MDNEYLKHKISMIIEGEKIKQELAEYDRLEKEVDSSE